MNDKDRSIKLVALDMDGTLLTKDHEVSVANQEMIAKAQAQGIIVMLCTGRWLTFCEPYAEKLSLDTYFVTVNGGEIWTATKELVERHELTAETIESMWHLGDKVGINMWMTSTTGNFMRSERPDDFYAYQWLKIGYSTEDHKKLAAIKKQLKTYEGLELTNSLPTNIEVNPHGVNKASALIRVCKELGITMDEVMAVGDSMNDIKMIEQAGIGVAMGNAQKEVKDAADFITDANYDDGVAKAIERLID